MYTSQENVRIVIAALKKYGIRKCVLSPGGTNIPVVQALQQDDFFTCYSVYDERSAIYFAIGLYLQTGEPIATSCTSAQATRNYVPGLTEAYYKHVPIIAITTSKLERYDYQDYMQAPDQCSLPKDSVKRSFDLPPVTDENTRVTCQQYVINGILEALHGNPGPVQINLRMTDGMLKSFEEIELPTIKYVKRYMAWDDWSDVNLENKKILLVIGEHRTFTQRQIESINRFCNAFNVAVYTNHFSNFSNDFSIHGNLIVDGGGMNYLQPDIIITIGGQTGDYPLFGAISKLLGVELWRVSEDGNYVDTYGLLTKIFECPDFFFFEKLEIAKVEQDHSYFLSWKKEYDKLSYDIDLPLSNLYVAQQLSKKIPEGSIMNYAILNSIRCWNYFPLHSSIQCYGNIAAFGIDGCNSMLIGESMETDNLSFIVTGDLAFFYDMNALGIRHIKPNVRVLLINNGLGVEFKLLTTGIEKIAPIEQYIAAKGHNASAKGWAESCGFSYLSAATKDELKAVEDQFVSPSDKPILLEVFTKPEDETKAISMLKSKNRLTTSTTKKMIKEFVGIENIEKVKNIFRK